MWLILLLATAVASSGRTAEDCEIGDSWTANYIRFECYEGEGLVVRGVRAIGCVPTDTESGSMILPGAIFNEKYFTYECVESGEDTVVFRIKNCRDSTGKPLLVDQSSKAADGTEYRCYRDETGSVKLSVGAGCIHKGKLYAVGEKWTDSQQINDTVAGKQFNIGKGIALRCSGDAKKGFYVEAYGCLAATGVFLVNGGFTGVGKNFVQCKIAASTGKQPSTASIKIVDASMVTCNANGTIVKSHTRWSSPEEDIYSCRYCVLRKIGCNFQGNVHKLGLILLGKKVYLCLPTGTGVFDFGDTTGCPMKDGTLKPFMSRWTIGTEAYQCRYQLKAGKVTTYIAVGCNFNGKPVNKYAVVGTGRDLKKCGLVKGKYYEMRDMTPAEVDEYYKAKNKPSHTSSIYGGVGGSGSGDELTGQPKAVTVPSRDGGKGVCQSCFAQCTASCKA